MIGPWHHYIINHLSDKEWHSLEELYQASILRVPAEIAFRKAGNHRMYRHRNPDGTFPDPQDVPRAKGDPVKTGRRMYVNGSISNMRKSKIIEVEDGKVRLLRFPSYYTGVV